VAVLSDGVVTAPPGVCVVNEARVQVGDPAGRALSNRRLKLSARGGRFMGKGLSCLRPPQAAA
jgi:hypothetical protein